MHRKDHGYGLASSDALVWGNNQNNLLSSTSTKLISTPQPIVISHSIAQISASEKHVSFLTEKGQVYSFGLNLDGRLGIGSSYSHQHRVSIDNPLKVAFPSTIKIKRIECGFSHVCAIAEDGTVYAWGLGQYGALGTGQFKSRSSPCRMLVREGAVDIACGAMHTGLLMSNGEVYMCGSNQYGELGINKPEKISTPILLNFNHTVKQIACGVFYTLLLTETGQVYGMGNNKYGQLGIGNKTNQFQPTLVQVIAGIVTISAGYHSAALDYYGNIYLWGSGSFGQLLRPKKYTVGVGLRQLSVRGFFGVATGEGKVFVWGNNTYGQLGNGSFEAIKEPTQLTSLRGQNIGSFACGVNFTIAVLGSLSLNHSHSRDKLGYKFRENPLADIQRINYYQRQKSRPRSRLSQQRSYPRMQSMDRHSPRAFMENSDLARTYEDHYSSRNEPPHHNYEQLFNSLSLDYEELLKKYRVIQGQINSERPSLRSSRHQEIVRAQINEEANAQTNALMKVQINHLSQQLAILRDEMKIALRKMTDLEIERDVLRAQKEMRDNSINHTIANTKAENISSMAAIENQYKHLLEKKDVLIESMNISHEKECQEFERIVRVLKDDIGYYKQQIASQQQRNKVEFQRLQIQKIRQSRNRHDQGLLDLESKLAEVRQLSKKIEELSIDNVNLRRQNADLLQSKQQACRAVSLKETQYSQLSRDKQELLKMLNTVDNKSLQLLRQNQQNKVLAQQAKTLQLKVKFLEEQLKTVRAEASYDKETSQKCESDLRILTETKNKLHKDLEVQLEINKEEKARNDQYKAEFDKLKNVKKDLSKKTIQLEQITEGFQKYKKKMAEVANGQDQVIKTLKKQVQQTEEKVDQIQQQKNQEIKAITEKKRIVERDVTRIEEDLNNYRDKTQYQQKQIAQLNEQYKSLHRKYLGRGDQIDKEREQKQQILGELGNTKRQITKYKLERDQMEKLRDQQKDIKGEVEQKLAFSQAELKETRQQLNTVQQKVSNLQKENSMVKSEMTDMKNIYEEQQRINEQLSQANREFAENENEFTSRINELENKLYELECQNKSYTPRYDALMIRNKELDQRNRELSDMVNKAIEIQAEAYKNNILKDVKIDTNQIIEQVREEQEFVRRDRRKKKVEERAEVTPELPSRVDQQMHEEPIQPYNKLSNQRIANHRQRVSESARKLAGILDLESNPKYRARSTQRGRGQEPEYLSLNMNTGDFERINSKMESLQHQKEQFMTKINSFAQKLKIL